jgi:hypothetical protein
MKVNISNELSDQIALIDKGDNNKIAFIDLNKPYVALGLNCYYAANISGVSEAVCSTQTWSVASNGIIDVYPIKRIKYKMVAFNYQIHSIIRNKNMTNLAFKISYKVKDN